MNMKKYLVPVAALVILFAAAVTSLKNHFGPAASPAKVYSVGILVRGNGYEPAVDGFKIKMAEFGLVEGKNITYDTRFVSSKEELPQVVGDFIAHNVDIIHTYSTPATQAAFLATKDMPHPTPIVFGSMGDPLLSGVIKGIERSGTNVTGVASLSTQLTAKRLQLLKDINPKIKTVAMPRTAPEVGDVAASKSVEIALNTADALGIKLVLLDVQTKEDNILVASKISAKEIDGIIVGGDSLVWGSIENYIARAIEEKLPLAVFDLNQVKKGALVGFGPDYRTAGEQAAKIAYQILLGKPPTDIPVEVPQKLLLAINLKTAAAIGLKLSDDLIKSADVLIKE